jgi:hypothetical protein
MQGEERSDRVDRTTVVRVGWPLGVHLWLVMIKSSLHDIVRKITQEEDEEEE